MSGGDDWRWQPEMPMWVGQATAEPDVHVGFWSNFELAAEDEVDFRFLSVSPFIVWLDGALWLDGPLRYPSHRPEFQEAYIRLAQGPHSLAIQVHHEGITTRIQQESPPSLACEAFTSRGEGVPLRWRAAQLEGYRQCVRRINPQLGWIEWCDTRNVPSTWPLSGADLRWAAPSVTGERVSAARGQIASPRLTAHRLEAVAGGTLAQVFGYERDDPSVAFFLRELAGNGLPPQGVWRRYDLGRVRLGRPRFRLDLPAGSVVEFALCEALQHGRVHPWITLSDGPSCNLDHYVACGGEQEFLPVTPKGGRYLEVHVVAPPDQVAFLDEEFVERHYHGPPEGSFACEDELLNRIWDTGVETYRACTEDALIDNPTRERGQWTGDVVTVGMRIAATAYEDMRLVRRGLVQSAECAREDGLVAGLCPGGCGYLSTYAAQWVSACVQYWELTGDGALLEQLYGAAERNVAAFEHATTDEGVRDDLGWAFMDWGYVRNEGPTDMGLNLHTLAALRDWVRWCSAMERGDAARRAAGLANDLQALIQDWLEANLAEEEPWARIGLHRAVLALRQGLLEGQEAGCVEFIKRHLLSCFPNDPAAPRLSSPQAAQERLITPYFGHYTLAALWEHGEGDFALDQYRTCWGWALGDGRTTWLEVFDTRWSHCHQWSGCPTWQLSRYVLGLQPRYDLGERVYVLDPRPHSLDSVSGTMPLAGTDVVVEVEWDRGPEGLRYRVSTPVPIRLRVGGAEQTVEGTLGGIWPVR